MDVLGGAPQRCLTVAVNGMYAYSACPFACGLCPYEEGGLDPPPPIERFKPCLSYLHPLSSTTPLTHILFQARGLARLGPGP
jgi:hypothetical protein